MNKEPVTCGNCGSLLSPPFLSCMYCGAHFSMNGTMELYPAEVFQKVLDNKDKYRDVGVPWGIWDVDAASNGFLWNMHHDIKNACNCLRRATRDPMLIIDLGVTDVIKDLMLTPIKDMGGKSNMDLIRQYLNGGIVQVFKFAENHNINEMVLISRDDPDKAVWMDYIDCCM